MGKNMRLTCYAQKHNRPEWAKSLTGITFDLFFAELAQELERFGINLERLDDDGQVIEINSYNDLLNAVRIASPSDGISNICVGHVIGKSPHLDPLEDIRRAVNRIAFAPETVAPDSENRKVCHNCGCGC
ncbi:hypothetical protein [Geomonas sp.]|uniref:hypothetical protein n=1 Tax=Geomonas sp. TaxID=2651584 RepID=UPI002B487FA6|nr:hypothetical protein [Geomonas sp.]HJV35996.1 hypothetical protein [Geomonas sp.]